MKTINYYLECKVLAVMVIGALLNAAALNLFLIPANVISGGVTGIAQLIAALLKSTSFHISTGVLLLLLNIPVAYAGWIRVGHRFTLYSTINVVLTTVFMEIIPLHPLTEDVLLNAVFGGVVQAIGVGITLKFGASSGGMDIVAMILTHVKDLPIGTYMFALNAVIVISAGFLFGWPRALYTLLQLYVSSRVVDAIHTSYVKLTAWVVTDKAEAMQKAISTQLYRGFTKISAKGGYTNKDKDVLMIVLTRYELYRLKQIVREVDPRAFTNVVETTDVFGLFLRKRKEK